jgi:tetraacyldisaccharide 4'-kinase
MKTPSWFLKRSMIAWLSLPLSFLYLFISQTVFIFRRFRQKSTKIPVICIGGLLAGGVGKTPIVREIAKKIGSAVVMRGYHGGDEAKMLKNDGLSVFTGADRIHSIKIAEKKRFKSVVMDDGFQNPSIKKDISILVFNSEIGIGNGFILPAGPMRESLKSICRADAIMVLRDVKNKTANSKFQSLIIKTANKYKKPIFYAENKTIIPTGIDKFIAFAGIGYPQKFFKSLPKKPAKTVAFPDHHKYKKSDIKNLLKMANNKKATLLTTEKDWVRLPLSIREKIKFSPLETKISSEFYLWLKEQLVRKNG